MQSEHIPKHEDTRTDIDPFSVTVSSRGYITNEIGVEYIRDFHRQTAHLEGPRFLFVDGHGSHCTLEFLEFAAAHNIIVISYPPHTTHWLQGLDVACFGPLKIYWSQECDKFWRATGKRVNNDTFLLVYSRARARAFTADTIKSAWRATGLIPFRKDFFHAESDALAPARETSVKGGFPLSLPSPVRAVVDAHRRYKVAARVPRLAIVPETDEAEQETNDISIGSAEQRSEGTSRTHLVEEEEPGDGVEVNLTEVLHGTSAAFLISGSPLKSTSRLTAPIIQSVPADLRPNYSILQDGTTHLRTAPRSALEDEIRALRHELRKAQEVSKIERSVNEAANAQLILRDVHLDELTEKLHGKEQEKTHRKRNKMSRRNARWLSGDAFLQELREEQQGRAVEQVVRPERVQEAVVGIEAGAGVAVDERPGETKKQWRDRERAERMAKQKEAIARWEEEVTESALRGVPAPTKLKIRKLFPAAVTPPRFKPKRNTKARKKRAVEDDEDDVDQESEESGADEEDFDVN